MSSPRRVVIPFATVDAKQNPNASKQAAKQSLAYAEGAAVTFASLRRWNPDLRLTWYANGPTHPALQRALDEFGVETVAGEFTHQPPKGFMRTFAGSLFLLDALQDFRADDALFLDPDIVCAAPLGPLFAAAGRSVAALPNEAADGESVNGVDIPGGRLLSRISATPREFAGFIGGEALFVPGADGEEFRADVQAAYREALQGHERGELHFSTEEHLFSHTLSRLPYVSLAPFVKRMWTAITHRTTGADDLKLALWHLPAEKGRGFSALYAPALDRSSWFWTADDDAWRAQAARCVGVTNRTWTRRSRDEAGRVAKRIKRAVR